VLMDDIITQLYTLGEIRVGDKLSVGGHGELSIDRAGATQVLWRSLRRDSRVYTLNVLNALCIRVQVAVLTDVGCEPSVATALRTACCAAVVGLKTLSQTYKIGEVDDVVADGITRVVTVLTHTCCVEASPAVVTTSTATQTHTQTPTQAQSQSAASRVPSLPVSPPAVHRVVASSTTSVSSPVTGPRMPSFRGWRKRGAGVLVASAPPTVPVLATTNPAATTNVVVTAVPPLPTLSVEQPSMPS
jgi:hypothetical protein